MLQNVELAFSWRRNQYCDNSSKSKGVWLAVNVGMFKQLFLYIQCKYVNLCQEYPNIIALKDNRNMQYMLIYLRYIWFINLAAILETFYLRHFRMHLLEWKYMNFA